MIGHMTTVYIAATEKSGIQSVADFGGKTIGWPAVGSSAYYVMKAIVEGYGFQMDDLKTRSISISDQVDAMKDSQLDVFSGAGAIPMAGCTELALNCDIRFISLDDEAINEKILKDNPSWVITSADSLTNAQFSAAPPLVASVVNSMSEIASLRTLPIPAPM